MSGARLLTFGCRLNLHESERMQALTGHLPDVVVINTCAVTTSAERQARQAIRRAHRDDPCKRIVVTGCAAQIAPQDWGQPARRVARNGQYREARGRQLVGNRAEAAGGCC